MTTFAFSQPGLPANVFVCAYSLGQAQRMLEREGMFGYRLRGIAL